MPIRVALRGKTKDMLVDRLEQILDAAASEFRDRIAVGDVTGREITYGSLHALAESAAGFLAGLGVVEGDRVGLCLPKTIDTLVLALATLKLGAAYVPVDVSAPADRSATIFSDCTTRIVICTADKEAALASALAEKGYPVDVADGLYENTRAICALNKPAPCDRDLAYILYTSGSTGRPKGVAHTHASALAFVDWCSQTFSPTADARFSSHAPFHFDLSILDIYVPLRHGAFLRLISAEEGKSPSLLARIIEENALTNWYSTPSVLRSIVEFGQIEQRDHSSLRVVCFAGEVFPPRHLRALVAHWPQPRYFNLFGPTETNVCTAFEVKDPAGIPDETSIPIGFAASGDSLMIVDVDDKPLPAGAPGELVVHGPSVMREYWNAADKTAAAFLSYQGKRWYRTGDIVQPGEDGALIYRGRRDRMVKRRGYRIELGEIEAALSRHNRISQAAAVPVELAPGEVQIVAFHTWDEDAKPSLVELKRHCARTLPAYMIPDRLHRLDALPQTSTDKLDYQKMKEIAHGLLADS